jgi:hypothetical protein
MGKLFSGAPHASSLRGAMAGARVVGDPRSPDSPLPQQGKPTQPAPPASDVPAPAYGTFEHPPAKVTWPMKKAADLKSVSEAIGAVKQQMSPNGSIPDFDISEAAEDGSHVKTHDAKEHDLKEISEAINDKSEEDDGVGEVGAEDEFDAKED